MIIVDVAPGSVDWHMARAGIPTASEFHNLVTPKFEIRKGEMPKSYLARKLAEKWLGGPLASFASFDMEQGQILEQEAIPWYELEYSATVERPGFITTDDGLCGCSPDGWLVSGVGPCGLEIKCPQPETHVKYLLNGTVPDDYLAQVHGGMSVTGASAWQFVSYRRKFPSLVLRVERNDRIQGVLQLALAEFNALLSDAYNRLCEMNGGPPRRPARFESADFAEPVHDENDVPTP